MWLRIDYILLKRIGFEHWRRGTFRHLLSYLGGNDRELRQIANAFPRVGAEGQTCVASSGTIKNSSVFVLEQ